MTTSRWRRVLGALLGLNLLCHLVGWPTICSTLRETFHLETARGRAAGRLTLGAFDLWFWPHLFDPRKRPG